MHGIENKLRMWINGCMNNYFYNVVLKLTSNNDFAYLPTSINPMLPNQKTTHNMAKFHLSVVRIN